MQREEAKRNRWIFQILSGRNPQETTQWKEYGSRRLTQEFYRRIETVTIQEGIKQEEIERILEDNYFVGMKIYSYIIRKYTSNKVKIFLKINSMLRIQAFLRKNEILIYIPEIMDELFDTTKKNT